MAAHADILDQSDSLRNPLIGSLVFHVGVICLAVLGSVLYEHNVMQLGSPNPSGGGTVAITPTATIPLPARSGRKNPVANDTEFNVPAAPKEQVVKQKVKAPEPDAIPLKSKVEPKPVPREASKYRPDIPVRPNQTTSSSGPALSSDMIAKQGAGTIGVDRYSVLGSRFGAYAALLMERVSQRWNTAGLEGVRPMAIVSVDILRNGSVRNPHLIQTSGNYQLDTTSLRAVTEASPFPPLPQEYEQSVLTVEFKFQIQR
jgi:TonB family protein